MTTLRAVSPRVGVWIAVVIFLSTLSSTQQTTPIRPLPLPDARIGANGEGAEGNEWMNWSADRRSGYVQGVLVGSTWGYLQACAEAGVIAHSVPDLQNDCLKQAPNVRFSAEQYVALMTEFYSKYPQDRALSMRRLLTKLSEPQVTVDGVHKWLDELIESVRRAS
jgi:hypothetical protein